MISTICKARVFIRRRLGYCAIRNAHVCFRAANSPAKVVYHTPRDSSGGLIVAQRISGAYRMITIPAIYKALMFSLGADRAIARYVDEVLRPQPGMKILDVGCGPANILSYLPSVDYTGIDLNEKHIVFARQRYGSRGRFVVGNASNLRQDKKQFDLINVSALLHHLADSDAASLFNALKELLKPGGRIVTIDNVWLPKQRFAVKLVNKMDSGINIRTPEGYLKLLNGLGFEIQARIFNDLLRIPYDHFVMVVRNA